IKQTLSLLPYTTLFRSKNDIAFDKEQNQFDNQEIVFDKGFFAKTFPVKAEPFKGRINEGELPADRVEITDYFSFQFHTAGIMRRDRKSTRLNYSHVSTS